MLFCLMVYIHLSFSFWCISWCFFLPFSFSLGNHTRSNNSTSEILSHPSHILASQVFRWCQMPRYVLSERFLHSKRKRAGLRSIPQAVMSGALMLSNLEIFADKFCFRLMTSEWKSKMAMRFFRRHCRGVNYSKWCFMYIQLNIFVLYVDLLFYMHGRAN